MGKQPKRNSITKTLEVKIEILSSNRFSVKKGLRLNVEWSKKSGRFDENDSKSTSNT